jgi:two-component system sensor histidine kinase PilS (NtrC family)
LHVIDDGPGVAKDLQSQLFEPFFTTYSAGTGLGLYIARELCGANGAALDYVDRGAGGDFRITWQGVRG